MTLDGILVSFVLHLGIILPVTVASKVNIAAGETIVLLCPNGITKTQKPASVVWKHEGAIIINYIHSQEKAFMVNRSAKYKLVDEQKGNFSLWLPDGKEGKYSCEVEGEPPLIYDLQRWHGKISPSGYVLQGKPLLLEVTTSGKEYSAYRIEWLSPHKAKVTGNEPRWVLENNDRKLQIKNLTVQEDHGTWKCHVLPNGPQILFDVKVIGFLNALGDDTRFAAVNNSVVLSCPLNINLTKEKSLENFPELQSWDLMKDNKILIKKNVKIANNTFPAKEIPKVQFEDAGNYHCHFTFAKGHLNKSIHLIVMKVSASHPAPFSEKANVFLCCHISAPASLETELCWVHVNETRCSSHPQKRKFCQENPSAGLWRCDLKVKNDVKISINYTVEADAVKNGFPLVEILSGVGVLLLIFAGLFVCAVKPIKQKRQRARRMALAKQHLLEKKTCQCERELTNDYYHT